MMARTASIKRDTKETRIALTLSLDGTGTEQKYVGGIFL